MTKRAGPYRHIKPLPGPVITSHSEWVCIGCGRVEWLADGHRRVRHCQTGCWTLVVDLTGIGIERDVLDACYRVGGSTALYAMIKSARAEHGLPTDPVWDQTSGGFLE